MTLCEAKLTLQRRPGFSVLPFNPSPTPLLGTSSARRFLFVINYPSPSGLEMSAEGFTT